MDKALDDLLDHAHRLPEGHGKDGIVHWHCFRQREAAVAFIPSIRLDREQQLVGGRTEDSLGPLWWVGVRIPDLDQWGNVQAVNKHGASP